MLKTLGTALQYTKKKTIHDEVKVIAQNSSNKRNGKLFQTIKLLHALKNVN